MDRPTFEADIAKALPGFAYYLKHDFILGDDFKEVGKNIRFNVKVYHHPPGRSSVTQRRRRLPIEGSIGLLKAVCRHRRGFRLFDKRIALLSTRFGTRKWSAFEKNAVGPLFLAPLLRQFSRHRIFLRVLAAGGENDHQI